MMPPEKQPPDETDAASMDRAIGLFSSYRQTGWGLSATIVGFATVLLAWALPDRSAGLPSRLFYAQAVSALATIATAFFQQLSYYQGGKHFARVLFGQSSKAASDRWFLRADACALIAPVLLLVTSALSICVWLDGSASLDTRCAAITTGLPPADDGGKYSLLRVHRFYSPVLDSCINAEVADVGVHAEIRDLSQSLLRDPGKNVLLRCDADGADSVVVERVRQRRGHVWEVPHAEWLDDGFGGPARAMSTPERPYTKEQCRAVFDKWMRYLRPSAARA